MRDHVWHTTQRLMETIEDEISPDVLERLGLPTISEALRQIHYPTDCIPNETVLQRLAYREVLNYLGESVPVRKADTKELYDRLPLADGDQLAEVNAGGVGGV
jgi:RecG-like helicase